MIDFRSLFRSRISPRRSRAALLHRALSVPRAERLENREMLAGNVTAQLVGQSAFILGDRADNAVEILSDGGNVIVRGTDGTTINGSSEAFVLAANTSEISGSLFANLSRGDDSFVANGVSIGRNAFIDGASGNDLLVLFNVEVGRNLRVSGSSGNDDIVIDASQIGRDTHLRGWGGDDDIVIRDSALGDDLVIATHRGNDVIMLDGASVGDKSWIFTGGGRDNVVMQGSSQFADRVRSFGGGGSDRFQASDDVTFSRLKKRSFSGSTVSDSIVESRITDPTTGALGAAEAAIGETSVSRTTLSLSTVRATFDEDTGTDTTIGESTPIVVTVNRDGDTTSDLVVSLTSTETARLNLPASVTIPAGQTEQIFTASTVVPDTQVNGDVVVTINATVDSLVSGQIQFTLLDNDVPTLTSEFSAPTISEDGASTAGQANFIVTRNTPTDEDLAVTLTVSQGAKIELSSSTLTIPAGSDSASVIVTGVANTVVDGDISAAVTASATGFAPGSESIVVTDDDDDAGELSLLLTSGVTVAENAGTEAVTATVSRNVTNPTDALIVSLTTIGDERLSVPATVTIPAGQQSVDVTFDVIDNNLVDASGLVASITASATSFASSTTTVTVTEDDLATITLTPARTDVSESAGTTSLTVARNSDTAAETIALGYSNDVLTGPATVQFAIGELEQTVSLNIVDNDSFVENTATTITASAPGRSDVSATIAVTDDDLVTLTADVSDNTSVDTVGALITRDDIFTVNGTATPGATVQIESDGDGQFDDQSTVAAANGSYAFDIPLTNTTANNGLNQFQVRAVVAEGVEQFSDVFNVHLAEGTVMRFEINQDIDLDGTNDFYDVELLDTDAPNTVANFLSYVNDGTYDESIIHRSPPGFVIQGGGFDVVNRVVSPLTTRAAIANEFDDAENSNVLGTLSTALSSSPNSATSGWFINVADNSNLDANKHTVFGRVIAGGIGVVGRINTVSTVDLRLVTGQQGLLDTTPLANSPLSALSGTFELTNDSDVLIGTDTAFTTELSVGSVIVDPFGQQLIVNSITSDTELTVDVEAQATEAGVPFTLLSLPADDDYLIFTNIGEILDLV